MKARLALSVVTGGFLAIFVVMLVQVRRQGRELANLQQRLTESARETERWTAPLREIATRVGAYVPAPAASANTAPKEGAVPTDETASGSAGAAKPEVSTADLRKRYEMAFVNETKDADWAAEAKRIVDAKLPQLLPEGSSVRGFECRASMCRLETAHKDFDSYVKFVQATFLDGAGRLWNGGSFSTPLNDDPAEGLFVTFIAREGRPQALQ